MPRPLIDDRRRRILDAARDLILERGWSATSVADIAARAGIGKGAVYLEFADKADVLGAVLQRGMRDLTVDVHRRVAEADALVDLAAVYRFGVEALLADPLMRALYLGDESVLGAHVAEVADRRYVERMSWLADYVERLQGAGVLDARMPVATIVRTLSVFSVGLLHAPGVLGVSDAAELSESVGLFADAIGRSLASSDPVDVEAAREAQLALLRRLDAQLVALGDER